MRPTNLIRCVAATLAASTLLSAQSAPIAPAAPQAPRARSDAKATDRMQVRLAEVIAMLEEDDLSPEQRAQAKRKLEEIVAKLRETPAPAGVGLSAPSAGPVAGVAPTPRPPRAARTPVTEAVVVPQEPAKGSQPLIVEKRAGREGEPPTVVYRTEGGEYKVSKPADGAKTKVYRVDRDDNDTMVLTVPQGADVEKLQAEARKLRAEAEAMRTKIRALAERADGDEAAETRKLGSARVLLDKSRADAADAARANDRARARDQAVEAEVRAKRAHDEARAQDDDVRARSLPLRAQRSVSSDAGTAEPAPRARARREAAADGDADIKKLMEDMRNEMREIRQLLQQMRKQAQSWQTPRNSNNGFDNFGPAGGNTLGMGGATGLRAGAQDSFGQQAPNKLWRGAFGGMAGKGADEGDGASSGQNLWWTHGSGNKAADTGASPFWGLRGTGTTNTESGANRAK